MAIPLQTRLKNSSWMPEEAPAIGDRALRTRRLYILAQTLVFLSQERVTFGPLLCSLFLSDVLATLAQLGYEGRAVKVVEQMSSSVVEATPTDGPLVDTWWRGSGRRLAPARPQGGPSLRSPALCCAAADDSAVAQASTHARAGRGGCHTPATPLSGPTSKVVKGCVRTAADRATSEAKGCESSGGGLCALLPFHRWSCRVEEV